MKDKYIGAHVDHETVGTLREIARVECEGNQSMALRKVLREAAERRGVTESKQHAETQKGG